MALVKRNENTGLFPSLTNMLENFFNDDWFFGRDVMPMRSFTVPAVNVKETEDSFELEVAAPGMDKKEFKIEGEDIVLTISSEKEMKNEEKDEKGNYVRREFSYQSFKRSFVLPDTVNTEKIEAKYKDGILHVSVPKREEAKKKATRLIEVK